MSDSLRFEALGLDVDDDKAREIANKIHILLDGDTSIEGVEGVAPVLREEDDRHPSTRDHTPSTAWLEQSAAAEGSEAIVRGDELFRVTVERVELRDGESSDGRGGVRPVPSDVDPVNGGEDL